MTLYLDNCTLNRPFDDQRAARVRLETEAVQLIMDAVARERVDVVWSCVLDLENRQNPFDERRVGVAKWKEFAAQMIDENRELQERAQEIATLGFKPLDALHLSSAVTGRADHFITVDDGILSKSIRLTAVAIMSPLRWIEQFGEKL